MEPADKPFIEKMRASRALRAFARRRDLTVIEFLPDADEIERRPLPPLARTTLWVLLAMVASFVLWASLSQVDRVVVARGQLVTPLPNLVVQPLETSIIQSIDVRLGQIVKKGDRLATLDPTFATADQAQLKLRLKSLETQIQRLQAELGGGKPAAAAMADTAAATANDADGRLQAQLSAERQANFRAQSSRLDETIARLRASIETNRRDQELLAARVKSLGEMESMQEKLVAQNFGARAQLLSAQEKRLEVERDMQLARNKEQELNRELAALQAERAAFGKGWRQKTMEDLLSTSRERDAVLEDLSKADKRQNLVTLTAPSDAVVLNIGKFSQGAIIREAEPLFTLVPLAATLEAEVQIDSMDVGYIRPGDTARLKFDAFPFQRHGTLHGEVRTISEDAFRRENGAPLEPGMAAYYISRVSLGAEPLKRMSDRSRLLPGMTVSAEIVVGQRSVISYLIWPLTRALDESIREP
jgi:HlyD family secretion protein